MTDFQVYRKPGQVGKNPNHVLVHFRDDNGRIHAFPFERVSLEDMNKPDLFWKKQVGQKIVDDTYYMLNLQKELFEGETPETKQGVMQYMHDFLRKYIHRTYGFDPTEFSKGLF
jgi:hypothetical protein